MNTIYWRMNATQGGANLHPGVNLLPGANLHPGANCAHEHGLSSVFRPHFCCVPGSSPRVMALIILANKTVSGYPVIVPAAKYDASIGLVKWS